MSWFKKLFSSQGSSSSQCSSQEPTVKFTKESSQKDKTDNKKEEPDTTVSEFEEIDETQSTQDSSCYSWSGVIPLFDRQGKKRGWSDDEETEEPWWESVKSQSSTQKSSQKSETFQLSQATSSQSSQQENTQSKTTEKGGEKDDESVSFYLKVGKYKKFKYM